MATSSEVFDVLTTNEELVRKTKFDEEEAIEILLRWLVEELGLFAASALFNERLNNLYSPIFVYPEDKKQIHFVELDYDEDKFDRFRNRDSPLSILDIERSNYYKNFEIEHPQDIRLSLYSMPIRHSGRFMGILNCYTKYGSDAHLHERLIRNFAERLGNVITLCYQDKKEKYYQRSVKIAKLQNLADIHQACFKACIDLGPKPLRGFIGIVNELTEEVEVKKQNVHGWGDVLPSSRLKLDGRFPQGVGITGNVVTYKEMLLVHDVKLQKFRQFNYQKTWQNIQSSLCVPIITRDKKKPRVYAVICLESESHFVFSQTHIQLVQHFAEKVALAIEAGLKREEIYTFKKIQGESLHLGTALDQAHGSLAAGKPRKALESMCQEAANTCKTLAGTDYVFIASKGLNNPPVLEIIAITQKEELIYSQREIPIGKGLAGLAVENCKTSVFNNGSELEPGFIQIWQGTFESELVVPIIFHGEAIGVINIESRFPNKFRDKEKKKDVERVARLIAPLFAKARFHEWSLVKFKKLYTIIGDSPVITKLERDLTYYARYDFPVLIMGESGTGKELVARRIHYESARKNEQFIVISCTEINPNLIESELFGHKEGAFTSASKSRVGKLVHGHGGTVFFDELGDLPKEIQGKLLRVLQEREVTPLGSNEAESIDIRVIAATNKFLPDLVERGEFREDLYHRFGVFFLRTPSLRDRKEDIAKLANWFLKKYASRFGFERAPRLSKKALNRLLEHNWPGNVRQLEYVVIGSLLNLRKEESSQYLILPEHILFIEDVFNEIDNSNQRNGKSITRKKLVSELYNQRGVKERTYKALGISRTKAESLISKGILDYHSRLARKGKVWEGEIEPEQVKQFGDEMS